MHCCERGPDILMFLEHIPPSFSPSSHLVPVCRRVLAEFQSRKAHRVLVRDMDLLKYVACIVLVVVGYMAAWTAVTMDHVDEGNTLVDQGHTATGLKFDICKSRKWDYIIEIGKCGPTLTTNTKYINTS